MKVQASIKNNSQETSSFVEAGVCIVLIRKSRVVRRVRDRRFKYSNI